MTESAKATRATVQLGSMEVEGFMLPDGSYRMSLTQSAEAVGLGVQNASDFLRSKAIKSLLGEGYTAQISQIEIESEQQTRGQSRFQAMPLEAVSAYWLWQAFRGNRQALALCVALVSETLARRFDSVFGMQRSEVDYNDFMQSRIFRLEGDLARLGEAYAEPDTLREHVARLEQQIRDMGGEPHVYPQENEALLNSSMNG